MLRCSTSPPESPRLLLILLRDVLAWRDSHALALMCSCILSQGQFCLMGSLVRILLCQQTELHMGADPKGCTSMCPRALGGQPFGVGLLVGWTICPPDHNGMKVAMFCCYSAHIAVAPSRGVEAVRMVSWCCHILCSRMLPTYMVDFQQLRAKLGEQG